MKIRATLQDNELIELRITSKTVGAKGEHVLSLLYLTEGEAGRAVTELQRALVDLSGEAPF